MSLFDWLWRRFDRTKREFPMPFERSREPEDPTGQKLKGDGKVYPLRREEDNVIALRDEDRDD